MKKVKLNVKSQHRLISLFLLCVFLVYAFISVMLHIKYQTFGWDLGYFDQLIWLASQGIYPLSSLSKVNLLAGHFAPILVFLTPVYWIWSDPKALLVFQSLIMVFAGWPLYLLSSKKTDSFWFSFSVVFAYLFFIGTQWSILNEFHETTFVPLFISLIFYGLETNINVFWLGIIGLFGTKEEFSLLLTATGLMIWWQFKKPKLGILVLAASLGLFFILTGVFMPAVSEKGVYQHLHISGAARSPAEFIGKIISDPGFALKSMVTPIQKMNTLFWSLSAFGFMPVFAPIGILIPLIEQFAMRFLYTGPQFTVWQNVNHHAAPAAMLLAIATIYAGLKIIKFVRSKTGVRETKVYFILGSYLIISTMIQDVYLKAPIHSLLKRNFYQVESYVRDNNIMIEKIPDTAIVAAQNSLIPHLSQREKFYLLPEVGEAEFVAVDLNDGPNKYAPIDHGQTEKLISDLISLGAYKIYFQANRAILLKKI